MYFLGYDLGSSSVKVALVDAESLAPKHIVKYPDHEMPIASTKTGWAEQHPDDWWSNLCLATKKLLSESGVKPDEILSIGIAYQMHGLVMVNDQQQVLRPAIIWCDSRAVGCGEDVMKTLDRQYALSHLLNTPANFTASKLKWVKDNEPKIYAHVHKFMLPGDFIAMKMTSEINTTIGGLSEGVFWDFTENRVSEELMKSFGFSYDHVPNIVEAIGNQGQLSQQAAQQLGLTAGTPISYRAGDQPNNAMSLNVLKEGEVAATGGTSGVIYGVTNTPVYDSKSRVNGFAHVNHTSGTPSIGTLLCINGAGIQYSWLRQLLDGSYKTYDQIEKEASSIAIGSKGLSVLPFGNGAERIFENRTIGAQLLGIDFNRHSKTCIYRATLEGIAFAFVYGANIMKEMGVKIDHLTVGNDNLFQSDIFSNTLANTVGCSIEMYDTTGAIGAAKASGVGAGYIATIEEAMSGQVTIKEVKPLSNRSAYAEAYGEWKNRLEIQLNSQ